MAKEFKKTDTINEMNDAELGEVSGGAQATTCPQGQTIMNLACKHCLKKSPADGYTFTCDLGFPGRYVEIPKHMTN